MGMLPALAAAIAGYAEKMALSPQSKSYQWMKALFQRADDELGKLLHNQNWSEAQNLILDLGKEALEKNGDWVVVHRERTPEVRLG
jgi:hypothetical protein